MSHPQDTQKLAKQIRIHALQMTSSGGGSHIASCMSIADILAVLYGKVLTKDSSNPTWDKRDRFVLSKGHAGAALYATLAECGFFPVENLATHYQDGSKLSGHVSHIDIPGVEISTGSLGHGLSIAAGMALSAKLDGKKHRVVTLMSDGECDEGSVWEAALFAPHHRLSNLTAIIDYNKIQSLDTVKATLGLEPFADKWTSFGWNVLETDGHDHAALEKAFSNPAVDEEKPTLILAHTTKGKGVSFMESSILWHYRTARGAEFDAAIKELENL